MRSRLKRLYPALVFDRPWLVIAALLLAVVVFAWFAQYIRLDVSPDSLMMDGDPELEYSREITQRYGIRDAVLVSFTPDAELFSPDTLQVMVQLRDDLLAVDSIESVDSILDVPILAGTALTSLSEDYATLLDDGVDLAAAREEMTTSPVFSNAVVSPDGRTAALLASFEFDQHYFDLVNRRTELREMRRS